MKRKKLWQHANSCERDGRGAEYHKIQHGLYKVYLRKIGSGQPMYQYFCRTQRDVRRVARKYVTRGIMPKGARQW